MSKGHVLQVCPRYPPQRGGVERMVSEVADYLVSHGWEVTVATTALNQTRPSVEDRRGINILRFPAYAPGEAYFASRTLRRHLKSLTSVDIVHAHNVHALPSYYAVAFSNPPRVLSPHFHGTGHTFIRRVLHRIYQPMYGRRIPNLASIAFVSNTEAALFYRSFPDSRDIPATTIPNGVDIEAIGEATPRVLGDGAILTCGRLERYKHVDLVIRAFRWLPDKYHLHVVGRGPEEAVLRRLAQRTVPSRVTFHTDVGDELLYGMYKGCRLHVNLSEKEAFGITVLEALAAGSPVLVRKSMGLAELAARFPNNVRATLSLSPRGIAAEIENISRPPRVNLAEFAWSRIGASHEQLYHELLNRASYSS